MKKRVIIIFIVAVILTVFAGFWMWGENKKNNDSENAGNAENTGENSGTSQNGQEIDTSDWKTYKDEKYGFEIKYPKEWEIRDTHAPAIGGEWSDVIIDKNRQDTGMNIARFATKDPEKWLENNNFKEEKRIINGYIAYYNRIDSPKVNLNHEYFIINNEKIIGFFFMEKYRKFNPKTDEIIEEVSFSQYLPTFEAMVNSIKFVD